MSALLIDSGLKSGFVKLHLLPCRSSYGAPKLRPATRPAFASAVVKHCRRRCVIFMHSVATDGCGSSVPNAVIDASRSMTVPSSVCSRCSCGHNRFGASFACTSVRMADSCSRVKGRMSKASGMYCQLVGCIVGTEPCRICCSISGLAFFSSSVTASRSLQAFVRTWRPAPSAAAGVNAVGLVSGRLFLSFLPAIIFGAALSPVVYMMKKAWRLCLRIVGPIKVIT